MTRLNWNRPRRQHVAWYDATLLPWDSRQQSPDRIAGSLVARAKPNKPKLVAKPVVITAIESPAVPAGAFLEKAALCTRKLEQARDALSEAFEARIWCDGSASPNPGPMGWGIVIEAAGRKIELAGGGMHGTNNRAELTAAMLALMVVPDKCRTTISADSQYLTRGAADWSAGWKRKGWRKKGVLMLNADLWQDLDRLTSGRSVCWQLVRGHNGNRNNEIADRLATLGRGGGK